jgi:EmrB/QacA subfamily drug resistance transporter
MNTHHQKLKIKYLPIIVAVAFFMQMLDNSILNTAIPRIAEYIGEAPINMYVAVTSYMLSVVVFLPISGWLADRFGIKNIFLTAIIIFTIGSLLCALSNNLFQLSLSRIVQGAGGALMVPTGRLAVLRVFPRREYVKVISFVVLPALLGPLIGPTLGGFIVEYFSWHWIFLINIPVGIICCLAVIYVTPYIPRQKTTKFDWIGFLVFDIALLSFYFFTSPQGFFSLISPVFILVAAVFLMVAYFLYANNRKGVLFDLEVFKTRNFSVGIIGNFITRLSGGALPFIGPLFLQTALGYSPSKAGAALIPLGLGAMFAKSIVASLILKFGHRKFMIVNTMILGVFISFMSFINLDTPFYVILIVYALIGIANSMQFTATNTLTMIDVPGKFLSQANTLLSVTMQLCLALGVSLSALLLTNIAAIPKFSNPVLSFHLAYIITGVFTFMNFLIFMLIKEDKK